MLKDRNGRKRNPMHSCQNKTLRRKRVRIFSPTAQRRSHRIILILVGSFLTWHHIWVCTSVLTLNASEVVVEQNSREGFVEGNRNSTSTQSLFILLNNFSYTKISESNAIHSAPHHVDSTYDDCGLYLAPSTIPNAGLGIFTGSKQSKGDAIGNGDVCIPIMESYWNQYDINSKIANVNDVRHYDREPYIMDYFSRFTWNAGEMGFHHLVVSDDVQAFCPGIDSAVNCNLALLNVDKSSPVYDDGNFHRSKDASAGAITTYHNGTSYAIRDIPKGGELFKFYGDKWFLSRQHQFGLIPLSRDYQVAQLLLDKFENIRVKHLLMAQESNPTKQSMAKDLWKHIKNDVGTLWESRTMNALPRTLDDAIKGAQNKIPSLHQKGAMRSVSWLRKNGKCVDNIYPSTSTLPQAGRGAFAKRKIRKGTTITGSPLIHIPRGKDLMKMYHLQEENKNGKPKLFKPIEDRYIGEQLLKNYCYGHAASTLLLCPYGSGVHYINHNQTLVNVKIIWSQDGKTSHNNTLLQNSEVHDLEKVTKTQFAFDYIALRDIERDEEMFLDYGDFFEKAWQNHNKNWLRKRNAKINDLSLSDDEKENHSDDYISAERYNMIFANAPLRTVEEQKQNPYPNNLQLRCHNMLLVNKDKMEKLAKQANASANGTISMQYEWKSNQAGYPCYVLEREIAKTPIKMGKSIADKNVKQPMYRYRVKLEHPSYESEMIRKNSDSTNVLFDYVERNNVDRSAIAFFNKPYTTDLHLKEAFRCEIGIPHEIFPPKWRNLER